jgi:hypothetical protein
VRTLFFRRKCDVVQLWKDRRVVQMVSSIHISEQVDIGKKVEIHIKT